MGGQGPDTHGPAGDIDYRRLHETSGSADELGDRLSDAWSAAYLASTGGEPGDLVVVDPGNGFDYTFDLAGSLGGDPCGWPPRVVGVWGRSRPGPHPTDAARMRGHPRPGRGDDDRGHLVARAAGGGYDINLVPMAASLNRGWSEAGRRFRSMERRAAARPGSLYFVRCVYDGDTDRPCRFDVGVVVAGELDVESFPNAGEPPRPTARSALRRAATFRIGRDTVARCVDEADPRDERFARAWLDGPAALGRAELCAVAGVTGHVAESVAEVVLDGVGWRVLWHHVGPGRHGVDLVFLTPDGNVVAVEVKGTLVAGRTPRVPRREVGQMSADWVDKADNPGMADLDLRSADVYGGFVVVNFADLTWRVALTFDFTDLHPVTALDQLADLCWLRPPA
jgi:DNA/RNA non-specific endonuclease